MMAIGHNAAVVYRNLADTATLIASSQLGSAPASRVQTDHVVKKWRSTSNSANLVFDFGSATAADSFAAIGLTASTIRVRMGDDPTFAVNAYDSGSPAAVDQDYRQAVFLRDGTVSARYVRFDFAHASLAYVEAGRIVIGARSTFAFNYAPGSLGMPIDPSEADETRGGQDIINPRPGYRIMEPHFPRVSATERWGFVEAMLRENGIRKDALFLSDPAGTLARDTLWGRLTETPAISREVADRYAFTLRFKERL